MKALSHAQIALVLNMDDKPHIPCLPGGSRAYAQVKGLIKQDLARMPDGAHAFLTERGMEVRRLLLKQKERQ